jgi:elongation factor P
MIKSTQLSPGMTVSIEDEIYRVETAVKVSMARGMPFMKTQLKNLMKDEVIEKNFMLEQEVEDVKLSEKALEYLYLDGKSHYFLDIHNLDQVAVKQEIIEDKVNFLKEGTQVTAMCYGETIFSIDLPQFLELMIVKTEDIDASSSLSGSNKVAILETGAKIEVPMYIESGDVVKVDCVAKEFVQRV